MTVFSRNSFLFPSYSKHLLLLLLLLLLHSQTFLDFLLATKEEKSPLKMLLNLWYLVSRASLLPSSSCWCIGARRNERGDQESFLLSFTFILVWGNHFNLFPSTLIGSISLQHIPPCNQKCWFHHLTSTRPPTPTLRSSSRSMSTSFVRSASTSDEDPSKGRFER